jgi:hypothetical protein
MATVPKTTIQTFFDEYGALDEYLFLVRCINQIRFVKPDGWNKIIACNSEEEAQRLVTQLVKQTAGKEEWFSWEDQLLVQIVPGDHPPFRVEREKDRVMLGVYPPAPWPLIVMGYGMHPTLDPAMDTHQRAALLERKVTAIWEQKCREMASS